MTEKSITIEVEIRALKALALFTEDNFAGLYSLSSVYCEIMPKEIRLVATDGHSLALYRVTSKAENETEDAPARQASVLLPKSVIEMIDGEDQASITVDDDGQADINYISASGHPVTLHGVQDGGRFPDYRAVLPKQCNREMSLYDPTRLQVFVKAAKILCPSEESDFFFNHCILYSHTNEQGMGVGIIKIPHVHNFTGIVASLMPPSENLKPNMFWIEEDANGKAE